MRLRELGQVLKETGGQWLSDKAPSRSAALAYYAIFSVVPLSLVAITISGIFFGQQAARNQVVETLRNVVSERVALAVQAAIRAAAKARGEGPIVFGSAMLLFAAASAFGELQRSLNAIWKVKTKPGGAVWTFFRKRLLTFAMVLAVGGLLIVSLVATAALAVIRAHLAEAFPWAVTLGELANSLVLLLLAVLLFAAIYKALPDVKIAWRDVWLGATITAVLFAAGTYFIGLYGGRMRAVTTYGAAGFVIVILLWVYVSAMIFFFGAEFTHVWARHRGRHILPDKHAVAL